jgi:hypothetical protein
MRSGMSTAAAELGAVIDGLQGARKRQRARLELGSPHVTWDVEAELERAVAKNASTWKALERLGVRSGEERPLDFYFESAGALADRRLVDFMLVERGYDAEADGDGVNGRTPAFALNQEALDRWVYEMILAGYQCGGCRFAGWSATVSRP